MATKETSQAGVKDIIHRIWSPSDDEQKMVRQAYQSVKDAYKDEISRLGSAYLDRSVKTAIELADLGMDTKSIAAALLHDALKDRKLDANDIEEAFDAEVLFLAQGVTRLGEVRYQGMERHVESLRKLFVATSQDIRVLIIKLAERLVEMQALDQLEPQERKQIAKETLEVYAPIARRLNIGRLYTKLEDLAFSYTHPEDYKKVKKLSQENYDKSAEVVNEMKQKLMVELAENDVVDNVEINHRLKHLYSLYEKLQKKEMDIEQIYDIVALRIIVDTVEDCYTALGEVHSLWRPHPDRMKDYIASPKPNGYQSLHTTVFAGNGKMAEIQIRTKEMHQEAEYGVASHVRYKEKDRGHNLEWFEKLIATMRSTHKEKTSIDNVPAWIKEMTKEQKETDDPAEFMKNLQTDFFEDRIFVFTPNGDVIDLPVGSCPIDFAYHIHSDIGNKISGARINGKLSSLDTKLENGDIVEILTDKKNSPKRKWLTYTKTTIARQKIKRSLNQGR